jgi:cell division inhibitor SulA
MLLVKPSIGRMIAAVDADETTAAKSVPNSSLEARRSWREDQSNMTISNRWLVMLMPVQSLSLEAVRRLFLQTGRKGIIVIPAKRVICTLNRFLRGVKAPCWSASFGTLFSQIEV